MKTYCVYDTIMENAFVLSGVAQDDSVVHELAEKYPFMVYFILDTDELFAGGMDGRAAQYEQAQDLARPGDELAAAAARVCSEYDGVHRLRAALSKWFDARAGIHGSGGNSR